MPKGPRAGGVVHVKKTAIVNIRPQKYALIV